MATIAEKPYRRRREAGLSQVELAQVSGVAQSTIAGIEGGNHARLHPRTLRKLAAALVIEIRELLED